MVTNKFSSLSSIFNEYNRSFTACVCFLLDFSKEDPKNVPASPSKDDQSVEAKSLRQEIAKIKRYNTALDLAKKIIKHWNISSTSLKAQNLRVLRENVLANVPIKDEDGRALRLTNLPKELREYKDLKNVYKVQVCTWIETLESSTLNDSEECIILQPTNAPVYVEGVLAEEASGSIVDCNGVEVSNAKDILNAWNKVAGWLNDASRAGSTAKSKRYNELAK